MLLTVLKDDAICNLTFGQVAIASLGTRDIYIQESRSTMEFTIAYYASIMLPALIDPKLCWQNVSVSKWEPL